MDPRRPGPATRIDAARPGALADRIGTLLLAASLLGGLTGLVALCCWSAVGRV